MHLTDKHASSLMHCIERESTSLTDTATPPLTQIPLFSRGKVESKMNAMAIEV
jgi:hypothetical protein